MENFARKPESDPGHGVGIRGDETEQVTRFPTWKIIQTEAEKGNISRRVMRERTSDTERGGQHDPVSWEPRRRGGAHGKSSWPRGPSEEREGKSTRKPCGEVSTQPLTRPRRAGGPENIPRTKSTDGRPCGSLKEKCPSAWMLKSLTLERAAHKLTVREKGERNRIK